MSIKDDKASKEVMGTVTEQLPNAMFKVVLADGSEILAYLAGKMRLNRIRVLIGDSVRLVPDEYGKRARIVRRG